MTLNLVPTERSCNKYINVKYEDPKSYQLKDMADLTVFADKQMHRQTDGPKTICP